ncbi:MAG: 3-keto-5-aminohexanoate cleavage protein [Bacteroidetes bacterium]|nr:3-keto-5-aminohexanoate cleavage protein [Bacteroidota bacterium]
MIPNKEMTAYVPVTPTEIIADVKEAYELGINMVHLHARDLNSGEPTFNKEIYAEIISGIRIFAKDLIICVSTSGRNWSDFEKRSEVLELDGSCKPDFASLTLSSLNFNTQESLNSPEMIKKLATKMLENNIKPELEVFDLGMINYAKYLIQKGLIQPPYYFNILMGNIAGVQSNLLSLGVMTSELPNQSSWSAGGIGKAQLKSNMMSLLSGGGVRIGLEDNIWFDYTRTHLASNIDLLKRILDFAKMIEREPLSSAETRELLGM